MNPPSIGILGGVGAIASARFHLDLVQAWAETHDARGDADFPEILHYSRHMYLGAPGVVVPRRTEEIINFMMHELRDCDRIAVVCNSIVPYLPKVERLLTPVAACAKALKDVRAAILLASESTIQDRLYQNAYPHIEWTCLPATRMIERAIRGEKLSSPRFEFGSFTTVLGCTELSTTKLGWDNTISPTDEMIRILCAAKPRFPTL